MDPAQKKPERTFEEGQAEARLKVIEDSLNKLANDFSAFMKDFNAWRLDVEKRLQAGSTTFETLKSSLGEMAKEVQEVDNGLQKVKIDDRAEVLKWTAVGTAIGSLIGICVTGTFAVVFPLILNMLTGG